MPDRTPQIRVHRRGAWTRVLAEVEGRDVSHLGYAPRSFSIGPGSELRMAGLGDVATEPDSRRRGLAARVFARAMKEIAGDRFSCIGLFTGTDIVAHRMYRRFGFRDIARSWGALKLLDPKAFAVAELSRLFGAAGSSAPAAPRRWTLRLCLRPHRAFDLNVTGVEVREAPGSLQSPDLSVSMSGAAFHALCRDAITPHYAEAARLVHWSGDAQLWRLFLETLARAHRAVKGG